jgi:hypothetical protein
MAAQLVQISDAPHRERDENIARSGCADRNSDA